MEMKMGMGVSVPLVVDINRQNDDDEGGDWVDNAYSIQSHSCHGNRNFMRIKAAEVVLIASQPPPRPHDEVVALVFQFADNYT